MRNFGRTGLKNVVRVVQDEWRAPGIVGLCWVLALHLTGRSDAT
ncbi:MAG: hypothetical protein ABJB66_19050 [Gemmatimonadaceae bacterium]